MELISASLFVSAGNRMENKGSQIYYYSKCISNQKALLQLMSGRPGNCCGFAITGQSVRTRAGVVCHTEMEWRVDYVAINTSQQKLQNWQNQQIPPQTCPDRLNPSF